MLRSPKIQLLLLSTSLNLLLFSLFFILVNPIYDTNEDVFILYLLSGNFDTQATELLHYNHLLHPFLGLVLKKLFLLNDNINWYTLFLLFAHFLSCCVVAFYILRANKKPIAIVSYIALFVIFECRLLLNINFTNTSIILGCAGMTIIATWQGKKEIKQLIPGLLLLLIASFFRIHTLIPIAGISLPFIFSPLLFKKSIPALCTLIIAAGLILSFNQLHQAWYRSKISNWQKQEDYHQKIYLFYNNNNLYNPQPHEKWYTEFNLIKNGLPIDTNFLSTEKLSTMNIALKKNGNIDKPLPSDGKNWIWINNRIFFCTVCILLLFSFLSKKNFLPPIISLGLLVAGSTALVMTLKFPEYLLISCLFLLSILTLTNTKNKSENRLLHITYITLMLLMTLWGTIRIYKINRKIKTETDNFRSAYKEIAAQPDKLFIITGDSFPLQKFSVMDLPKNYPLPNILSSEHFMNNTYLPILNRFGSADVQSIPYNNRILFRGKQVDALENYFKLTSGKQVTTVFDSNQSSLQKVYRIVQREMREKDTTHFQ